MDNSPAQTGYNTEMKILARLSIMEFRTTEPHSPWQNKAESVINIIKGKSKRIRIQRNIPKRVFDFGIFWEAEIYYHTSDKDGRPALELLDRVQPKMSPTISFSGMYRKQFIYRRNRTNSQ